MRISAKVGIKNKKGSTKTFDFSYSPTGPAANPWDTYRVEIDDQLVSFESMMGWDSIEDAISNFDWEVTQVEEMPWASYSPIIAWYYAE